MSPVHELKEGATARTHIRVKLLCADKRLTCGSYPSTRRYSTVHHIRHVACHSLAHSGLLQPSLAPWSVAPQHLALHPLPLLGHIPFRQRRFWVLRCLDPLQGDLTSWLLILEGLGVYLFEGGRGVVCPQGWQQGCSCRCGIRRSCGGRGLGCNTTMHMKKSQHIHMFCHATVWHYVLNTKNEKNTLF